MKHRMGSIVAAIAFAGAIGTAGAHGDHSHAHDSATQPAPTAMSAEEIARTPVATDLRVAACWVRLLPVTVPSAAYFEIENTGGKKAVLQAAASPAYQKVSLHLTKNSGGMSIMQMAGDIDLPAGGKLAFAPNGYHVMLEQPIKALAVGDDMPLLLMFAGPRHVSASCRVRPADTSGIAHH